MKSLNAKRIAAIVTGAALLGAGLAFAGPLTIQNVPIISNSGQPVVQVVIGSRAAPSDGVAAGNIAAAIGNLAYTSTAITAWVNPNSTKALSVSVSSSKYSLTNQQVWLNESGVTSSTGSTYLFQALIGSVLNQGVQLQSPPYTKALQSSGSYTFPRTTAQTPTQSPYYAAGSVPTGGSVPQTSNNVNGNSGGGVNFNQFTSTVGSSSYDNILQVTNAQFASLASNWGSVGETENLFLTGFPVYDQSNSGSIQNEFAILGVGGAYVATFGKPIVNTTSSGSRNLNVPIKLLGQSYSIINETGSSTAVTGTTAVNGGKITLASSLTSQQTVYVGHNLTSGPWTIQLQDLAQTVNGTNAAPAIEVYYNGVATNETSITHVPSITKFNVSGQLLYLSVNSTFAGLYAYQKWAKMQIYAGVYKLQDGKTFNSTNDKNWYVNLLWTNTTSGTEPEALKDIVIYNYTPVQLTKGQSFSFITNPSAYKLTFVGDTLGNNYDAVTTSLGTTSLAYQNIGTAAGTKGNPTNITEPAQTLTVQSSIPNAFTYGGQASSQVEYLLTPYQLAYSANAAYVTAAQSLYANSVANAVAITQNTAYGTSVVLSYTEPDAANFISSNAPLYVQVAGYTSPSASSATTLPQLKFTSNSQTLTLGGALYNVTQISLENSRSLPLAGSGDVFTVTVTNAIPAGNTLSALSETAPMIVLNPANGYNFNQTEVATTANSVTYNQQNGQQTSVIVAQNTTEAVTNHVREYYTFKIGEESVPQNSTALDYLGFGIYNTTQGQSQTQILQMNYSINGNHNNATYISTQNYRIPVQTNFITEKGSKVASISPTGDTFDMALAVDTLELALTNTGSNTVVSKAFKTFGPYSVGQATNLPNVTVAAVNATPVFTSGSTGTPIINGLGNLTAEANYQSATEPVLLKNLSSTAPLVVLDSDANAGSSLILVGSGYVNSLSAALQSSYNISISSATSPTISGQAFGNNRILVAGYTAAQTTSAANSFIDQLYAQAASTT